jgi:hypothetical protein
MNSQSALALLLSVYTWMTIYNNDPKFDSVKNFLMMNSFTENMTQYEKDIPFCDYVGTIIHNSCLNETNLLKTKECNMSWIQDTNIPILSYNKIYYTNFEIINHFYNDKSISINYTYNYFIFTYLIQIFTLLITSIFVIFHNKIKSSKFSFAKLLLFMDISTNILFTLIYIIFLQK